MGRRTFATERSALRAIAQHGVLLVYPITNRAQPASLWSELYPGVTMHWAWDEGADERVVRLWQLREQLARSRAVVYSKWYKGRAVFFTRELFTAMLAAQMPLKAQLSSEARELLALLEEDSPQSSKNLRRAAGLTGKLGEAAWTRALRELWDRLLIVGTGEVDDGAFPSLLIGATRWIFEELWEQAAGGLDDAGRALLAKHLPPESAFGKHWQRLVQQTGATLQP